MKLQHWQAALSRSFRVKPILVPLAVLLCAPAVWGQTAMENINDFGLLGQLSTGITNKNALNIAPVACAPTSTGNALTFLDNFYGPAIFSENPNTYSAINSLATAQGTSYNNVPGGQSGGTSFNGMVTGTTAYLSATGANPAPSVNVFGSVFGTGTAPSTPATDANALAGLLRADDGIEMLIQWGYYLGNGTWTNTGGHAVTLDAMSISTTTGIGTVSFVDPWGNNPGNATVGTANPSASLVTADVIPNAGYILMTNYSQNNTPPQYEDGIPIPGDFADGQAVSGRIVGYVAEAVPDGQSTWVILSASVVGLTMLRRRFCS